MQLRQHPAPGLGELMPGWFVVPQNPLQGKSTPLVPSVTAAAGGAVVRVPHVGEILPGKFAVPQNPLRKALAGMNGLGCGACGLGAATDSGGLMGSLAGATSSITDWLQQPSFVASIPNWVLYGGAGLLAWILISPGGGEYHAAKARLRSQHRGYRRVGRSAGKAARAGYERVAEAVGA